MNTIIAKRAISKIARKEKVSEKEVRAEMEKAIMISMMNPGTHEKWQTIMGVKEPPTPEEFILRMASRIQIKRDTT